jgi:hypothetical protein
MLRSYAVPSTHIGTHRVEYRYSVEHEWLHKCDVVWDESVDSDVTASLDTEDKREGNGSLKLVVAGTVSDSDVLATMNIDELDISRCTHIEFWAKASTATAAADLQILLDDTAACASPVETLDVPALTAGEWTFCRVALANPSSDTAIISIGVEYNANSGANTIHVDGFKAVMEGSEAWLPLHRNFWRVDKDRRELVLEHEAHAEAPYNLLKLVGSRKPADLDADTDVCEIEPEYVINKAVALAMRARGDRRGQSRDAAHQEADRFEALAQNALNRMQTPAGTRWYDD